MSREQSKRVHVAAKRAIYDFCFQFNFISIVQFHYIFVSSLARQPPS